MPTGHCAHQLEFKRIMLSLPKINDSLMDHESPRGGFALVIALSLMAFVLLLLLSITTLVQVETRSADIASTQMEAEQAALLGLNLALGELQQAAGPDQRVTATADILANDGSKAPVQGRHRWAGVWDTSNYSPVTPDIKTFKRWLVSSSVASGLTADSDAKAATLANPHTIFAAVDASGDPDPNNNVIVEKIPISSAGVLNDSYYAYWVEDEGVKADLAWNEGEFAVDEDARKQAARLSSAPGVDYGVFAGDATSPFKDKVAHPLEEGASNNSWLADISKVVSPSGLPVVTGSNQDATDWLNAVRHDITFGSRAVLCDVKNGGLRRDLSLAFEMDGMAESENATLFNEQSEEFVGNGDVYSSPYEMPGIEDKTARHLFRDTPDAGGLFSDHITQAATVVRGPSWWLLRDYANLYKRLTISGSHHSMEARAYFPNRSVVEDLMDIHADNQFMNWAYWPIKVSPTNRETSAAGNYYAYRPARANYAPVLLGVNAIYSLVYKNNRLQLAVDPFFIIWNPYNSQITADRFAVTLEHGLAGGVRFKVTDSVGIETLYGRPSSWGGGVGSDTFFADYAKQKSGVNAHLSYLISNLTMSPGEVLIYSPPKEAERSSDANVLNDELVPGMNYDPSTSGIFFDEFPDQTGGNWGAVTLNSNDTIDVLFNIASQSGAAIVNIIETSLPSQDKAADELTHEAEFGDQLAGQEFRLNLGGGPFPNVNTGAHGFSQSYSVGELGAFKKSFGILSMLTMPTDYAEAATSMEVFSQLNATPIVRTQLERFARAPLNIVVKTISADGFNNLMEAVGIDLDAFGEGKNGFYGKSYDLAEGDSFFPLLDIPKAPLYSLVQLSGANMGTRLFEPTHAIGNSWKPPYIPGNSIYHNSASYILNWYELTMNDVSWQSNDALFDRYYLSGIAPDFTIDASAYSATGNLADTLRQFYGSSPTSAKANPALEPYFPEGKAASDVVDELSLEAGHSDGYKKLGAYSLIRGAFNVNSTSVAAWSALLRANKDLAIEYAQGESDASPGSPFPLSSSPSNSDSLSTDGSETIPTNGWEKFSRLTDEEIWDDRGTPNDRSDDTGLAAEIVNQVKIRGPFMSLADFVNRRISDDSRSAQGAIQEAIEQAGINGNQSSGIRATTSETIPNYSNYPSLFPYADAPDIGARNNATGIPLEVNQANVLLPIAPKLTARSDTFKIRAYGEVVSMSGDVVQAVCEATVQRVPEYVNTADEPWIENDATPLFSSGVSQLDSINQVFGRRFKIVSVRWLDHTEM